MKKALIFQGGWDGHQPDLVSKRFAGLLETEGFEVEIHDTLDCLSDGTYLKTLDLIVACWTMGEIKHEYVENVSRAIASGVGLAGCHGGMCDAFRQSTEWQFMTGGQWVSHPGGDGVAYTVNICEGAHNIVQGLSDFEIKSEQYYLHVDPAIEVLATTRFPLINGYYSTNKPIDMPVAWIKYWGNGRVFYTSLGHQDQVFEQATEAEKMMKRGLIWAAEGKEIATEQGLTTEGFENNERLY
ncbi:MAG: ThuA domain-containing protein [Cellulosilyticaceae bacterium]